jgi:hypothetical protein
MDKICIKAQSCPSSPACHHGRPHDIFRDCYKRECFVGGQVRCKPVMMVAKNEQGPEVLADNLDARAREIEERR